MFFNILMELGIELAIISEKLAKIVTISLYCNFLIFLRKKTFELFDIEMKICGECWMSVGARKDKLCVALCRDKSGWRLYINLATLVAVRKLFYVFLSFYFIKSTSHFFFSHDNIRNRGILHCGTKILKKKHLNLLWVLQYSRQFQIPYEFFMSARIF